MDLLLVARQIQGDALKYIINPIVYPRVVVEVA